MFSRVPKYLVDPHIPTPRPSIVMKPIADLFCLDGRIDCPSVLNVDRLLFFKQSGQEEKKKKLFLNIAFNKI